ncbi:unnamed protein product [Arctogadus glacialis]
MTEGPLPNSALLFSALRRQRLGRSSSRSGLWSARMSRTRGQGGTVTHRRCPGTECSSCGRRAPGLPTPGGQQTTAAALSSTVREVMDDPVSLGRYELATWCPGVKELSRCVCEFNMFLA